MGPAYPEMPDHHNDPDFILAFGLFSFIANCMNLDERRFVID